MLRIWRSRRWTHGWRWWLPLRWPWLSKTRRRHIRRWWHHFTTLRWSTKLHIGSLWLSSAHSSHHLNRLLPTDSPCWSSETLRRHHHILLLHAWWILPPRHLHAPTHGHSLSLKFHGLLSLIGNFLANLTWLLSRWSLGTHCYDVLASQEYETQGPHHFSFSSFWFPRNLLLLL